MKHTAQPNDWALEDGSGRSIRLITPEDLKHIINGTELVCIDGRKVIVGTDHIDLDTRFGYLAYGWLL